MIAITRNTYKVSLATTVGWRQVVGHIANVADTDLFIAVVLRTGGVSLSISDLKSGNHIMNIPLSVDEAFEADTKDKFIDLFVQKANLIEDYIRGFDRSQFLRASQNALQNNLSNLGERPPKTVYELGSD